MAIRKISLLITCCNQRPWLELVFPSAVAQRVDVAFEIIVCDDGSTDGVLDGLMPMIARSPVDVRHVWQPNQGFRAARSRNNGIRLATGDLLVCVDGDEILAPSLLADHLAVHAETAVLGCGLRRNVVVQSAADLAAVDALSLLSDDADPDPEHEQQRRWLSSDAPWMACLGGNFSVARADCLPFDERFTSWGSEDRDLAFRLFRRGLRPRLLPRPNAVHLKLPGSGFSAMTHRGIVALLRNKATLRALYPGGEMAPALRLVRFCHLDPRTDRWSLGAFRANASANEILDEFGRWSRRMNGEVGDARSTAV